MEVKTYRARTIHEAVERVKERLGRDAMILSTRKLEKNEGHPVFEINAVPASVSTAGPSDPLSQVKTELTGIKEMLCLLNHSNRLVERLTRKPFVLSLYARLIRNGIAEDYAKRFVEKSDIPEGRAESRKAVVKAVIDEMMNHMEVGDPFRPLNQERTVAAFVGTTGVGKTTTIAKLAANLMLRSKRRVGLISLDNYRIGGMEQLRTYARILGIPCFPAFNTKDLRSALRKLANRDAVLIDTAGQSQYDRSRIETLEQTMDCEENVATHLLLSVSTSWAEMTRTAVNFSPIRPESYIFTKLDEAESFGSMINLVMKMKRPVSYVTTGQGVPEDIEKATKKRLLNLALSKN